MIYLLLAVMMSALVPNFFRLGKEKKANQKVIIIINYMMATVINLVIILLSEKLNTENIKSLSMAIIFGIVTGFVFYGGFYFYQKAVHTSGVSLSSAFGKMGVIIPVVLSVILFNEVPSLWQSAGIAAAFLALAVLLYQKGNITLKNISVNLLLFFLIGGLGEFSNKIFQVYCVKDHQAYFIFFIFITALFVSLIMGRKEKWSKNDITVGIAVGIPNVLTSYFLIFSLYQVSSTVVFPVFSAGAIVLSVMIGHFLFREKLKKKEYLAIFIMVVAAIIINLPS